MKPSFKTIRQIAKQSFVMISIFTLVGPSMIVAAQATPPAAPGTPPVAQGITGADLQSILRPSEWYTTELIPFTACGGGTDVEMIGSENAQKAFLYFIQRGLTPQQSAGIVGNLQAESGVIPNTQELNPIGNGRGGYGIAQWTGPRRVAIEQFAANIESGGQTSPARLKYLADSTTGKVLDGLLFQLDYLYDEELMKAYKGVLDDIKASTTLRQASDIFLFDFERPADQGVAVQEKRAAMGEKILQLYGGDAGAISANTSCTASGAGFVGFPLITTKADMTRLNGGCLSAPAMCRGGHPYVAYDIIADTGTPVVSVLDGTVTHIGTDRCPGRLVSVTSTNPAVTVSYLHLSMTIAQVTVGQPVTAGQQIGVVGTTQEGCTIPHLHIDAVPGTRRPGCSRLNCPVANQSAFITGNDLIKLGATLYETYMKLP